MPVLYVVEQGAQLGREGQRLVVRRRGQEVAAVPLHRVEQVLLLGRVQPTTAALELLLDHGVPLYYLSQHGVLKGSLQPPCGKNLLLRMAQFRRAGEAAFRLQTARAIVAGKLHNERQACLRWGRDHALAEGRTAAGELERLLRQCGQASAETLLGLEGASTRQYYGALRALLQPRLAFPRRSRRPATDPVSALLNLAAGLLRTQVLTALEVVGFDPYVGYYHVPRYGRPALALDLMEEFRAALADGIAVSALTLQLLTAEDFEQREGFWLLTEEALERFVTYFDRRLREEVRHPALGQVFSYRRCIELQARVLARAVTGELPAYLPFAPEH